MKGKIALHGNKSKAGWSVRVQKPKKKKIRRFCLDCGKELIFEHGNAPRCGNERRKIGCAYRNKIKKSYEWKRKVDYNKRPHRKIKMLEYGRKYDIKRIRNKVSPAPLAEDN